LRRLFLFLSLVILTSLLFFLYQRFLVDYSLENLEFALSVTRKDPGEASPVTHRIYSEIVHDLALEEASREDVDFKSLVLLELASRSFSEAVERAGYARARFYLSQVSETKLPIRSPFLRTVDSAYHGVQRLMRSFFSLVGYLQKRFLPSMPQIREPFEFSSLLLLSQAEEKERQWRLEEAADLYRKYLRLYPSRPDRGFVAISLTQILIKQRKLHEAQRLLRDVRLAFAGSEEGEIAARLIQKIDALRSRAVLIDQLERLLEVHRGTPLGEMIQFKLGLACLSSYQLARAQELFKKLEHAKEYSIRQKAKFYLGWIYKLNAQFDQGAEVMLDLLDDPELEREMGLGLQAQLADIYYQKRDVKKSLAFYEALSKEGKEDVLSKRAASEAWVAMSELEQSGIYFFDLGDSERALEHLSLVQEIFPSFRDFGVLKTELQDASKVSLRDRAFQALVKRKIHLAWELFTKNLTYHPKDAWTHAGLATVYVLLADLRLADDHAKEGFGFGVDEYTSSVYAYVYGMLEGYGEAIRLYEKALRINPTYLPARYNLACMLLAIGRHGEALKILEALERSLANSRTVMLSKVLNNSGYALWWLGEHRQAENRFREALAITPDFDDAKKNLAAIEAGGVPRTVNFKE